MCEVSLIVVCLPVCKLVSHRFKQKKHKLFACMSKEFVMDRRYDPSVLFFAFCDGMI